MGLTEDAEKIGAVETESCFNVLLTEPMNEEQTQRLEWLLAETFAKENLHLEKSSLSPDGVMEFGPRMTFTSAFSSNAVSICKACNLPVKRLEQSRRFRFETSAALSEKAMDAIKAILHDKMTEEVYPEAIKTFDNGAKAVPVETVPIMSEGRKALEKVNETRGLGFDDFDLDYYTNLFKVSGMIMDMI